LWKTVMGTCYKSNNDFENALFKNVFSKMNVS
jgi:hypothetical protein